MPLEDQLKTVLRQIVHNDPSAPLGEFMFTDEERDRLYAERTTNVYRALALASQLGYECGIRLDPEEPDWPVVVAQRRDQTQV